MKLEKIKKVSKAISRTLLKWAMFIVIFATIKALVQMSIKSFFNNNSKSETKKSIWEGVKKTAVKLNDEGPVMVDKETRRDSVVFGQKGGFLLDFSFPNLSKDQIDTDTLKKSVINKVCKVKNIDKVLRSGVHYIYSYNDKSGSHVIQFKISYKTCFSEK